MFFVKGDSSQTDLTGSLAEYLRDSFPKQILVGREEASQSKIPATSILNANHDLSCSLVCEAQRSFPICPHDLSHLVSSPSPFHSPCFQPHWPTHSHLRAFAHAAPSAWNALPADGHMALLLIIQVSAPMSPPQRGLPDLLQLQ